MVTADEVHTELNGLREEVGSVEGQVKKISEAVTAHGAIIQEGNLAHWKDLADMCEATRKEVSNIMHGQELNAKDINAIKMDMTKLPGRTDANKIYLIFPIVNSLSENLEG